MKRIPIILLTLLLLTAACQTAATAVTTPPPTIAETAALPLPTATPLPPTLDLTQTNRATDTPVVTPPPATPTSLPTNTPPPNALAINITSVNENDTLLLGQTYQILGRSNHTDADHTIQLSLISLNNYLLAENTAATTTVGWQGALTIPPNISGAAKLIATLQNNAGDVVASDEVPIYLAQETTSERYLTLRNPSSSTTAVDGYNLFFDGYALFPVNNTITIAILAENCTTQVAQQNFVLGSSSRAIYWQGFIIIPAGTTGTACAVARFGTPLEENWREAVIPLNILSRTDSAAKGIFIGNPPAGVRFNAGDSVLVYGTAFAADTSVQITILLENGRTIANATTTTDYWGYWETAVILPPDIEGEAEITASLGDPANLETYIENKTIIQITSD